jgi:hypothetical protein
MDAVNTIYKTSIAAALALSTASCEKYVDYQSTLMFRWTVTGSDGDVRTNGCGFFATRHGGRIQFRAAPGEEVVETVHWEEVAKTSEKKLLSNDEAFWCANQPDVNTVRKDYPLYGEECLVAYRTDNATVQSVDLVDPVAADLASGVRLRIKVVRPGPLELTYKFPCDSSDRVHSDAWVPPIWTELTILP